MELPVEGIRMTSALGTLVVSSDSPLEVLSSAVLGGGFTRPRHIINHHVDKGYGSDDPAGDLKEVVSRLGIEGDVVGMMTAAYIENVSVVTVGAVTAVVTGGVSNAVAAGEDAGDGPGTINTIIIIDANMTEAAMVNAVVTATEAKALALRDLGVKSTRSDETATGTSTDAIAVACTGRGKRLRYSGPATPIGTAIGRAVRGASRDAIKKQDGL